MPSRPEKSVEINSVDGLAPRVSYVLANLEQEIGTPDNPWQTTTVVLARHRLNDDSSDTPELWKDALVNAFNQPDTNPAGVTVGSDERTDEEYLEKSYGRDIFRDRVTVKPLETRGRMGTVALVEHVYLETITGKPVEYRAIVWSSLTAAVKAFNNRKALSGSNRLQ